MPSEKSHNAPEKIEMQNLISVESLLNPAPPISPSTYDQSPAVIAPLQTVDSIDCPAMIVDELATMVEDTPGETSGFKNAYTVLQTKRHVDIAEPHKARARGTKHRHTDDEGDNEGVDSRMVGIECHCDNDNGQSKSAI